MIRLGLDPSCILRAPPNMIHATYRRFIGATEDLLLTLNLLPLEGLLGSGFDSGRSSSKVVRLIILKYSRLFTKKSPFLRS